MINILTGILGATFKSIIMATLSERVMSIVVVGLMEKLSASTKNTIDDKVVAEIKEKLNK
jgi:hypothetical protein